MAARGGGKRPPLTIFAPPPISFVTDRGSWVERGGEFRVDDRGFSFREDPAFGLNTPVATHPSTGLDSPSAGLRQPVDPSDIEIGKRVGGGAFGEVRLATHRKTGKEYAVKLMPLGDSEKDRTHKQREVMALCAIDSKYVVRFHNAFMKAGQLCLLMEYMDGGSLDKVLQVNNRGNPFPEAIIAKIAFAMLHGVRDLERKNILQRDIKPENVLINTRGEVKLCDLGVCGVLRNEAVETAIGTQVYFAPERISAQKYGVSAEVWSTGLTLLFLALGHYPYLKKDQPIREIKAMELLIMITEHPPPTAPEDASEEFRDFIELCLVKDSGRPTPEILLGELDEMRMAPGAAPEVPWQYEGHPFLRHAVKSRVDVGFWLKSVLRGEGGCIIEDYSDIDAAAALAAESFPTTYSEVSDSPLPTQSWTALDAGLSPGVLVDPVSGYMTSSSSECSPGWFDVAMTSQGSTGRPGESLPAPRRVLRASAEQYVPSQYVMRLEAPLATPDVLPATDRYLAPAMVRSYTPPVFGLSAATYGIPQPAPGPMPRPASATAAYPPPWFTSHELRSPTAAAAAVFRSFS